MTKNTGGPAFPMADPFAFSPANKGYAKRLAEGMSMRDYFAAKAPAVPDDFGWQDGEFDCAQRIVRWNYFYADLMIAESAK